MGITGASGAAYSVALVRALLGASVEVHLVISEMGVRVVAHELGVDHGAVHALFTDLERRAGSSGHLTIHQASDMFAPIASGSFLADAMVVIPCSMKTLSSVANGYSSNLLERAADVTLKERRPLVLVTRESPLSRIHLTNMLGAHEAGATIMPACPGFYHRPQGVQDMIDFVVQRVLDHLKIECGSARRWGAGGEKGD